MGNPEVYALAGVRCHSFISGMVKSTSFASFYSSPLGGDFFVFLNGFIKNVIRAYFFVLEYGKKADNLKQVCWRDDNKINAELNYAKQSV